MTGGTSTLLVVMLTWLAKSSLAYNKNNRLVEYYDKITIYNSTAPEVEVYSTKLYAFPYVTQVSGFFPIEKKASFCRLRSHFCLALTTVQREPNDDG